MRILLDHCVPKPLRKALVGHQVQTTAEMGWEELQNGTLLAAATTQFELFLTVDKNIRSQQNLDALPIAIAVLLARSNRLVDLEPLIPTLEADLANVRVGRLVEVDDAGGINILAAGR